MAQRFTLLESGRKTDFCSHAKLFASLMILIVHTYVAVFRSISVFSSIQKVTTILHSINKMKTKKESALG